MSKWLTNPCFCWHVIVVVIHYDVEDDQHCQVEVKGNEGHQAAELAIVHHKHKGGKYENFGDTVKGGLEQKKNLASSWQGVFLGPVSRKKQKNINSILTKLWST